MGYKYIFFDLDGTLTDPQEGIINSIVYSLEKMQFDEYTRDTLIQFIGPPLQYSFRNFLSFSEVETERAIKYYREFYSEIGMFQNQLFPEIPALLEELKRKGKYLFVATSKPKFFADKIIGGFGLSHFFVDIVGSELDGRGSEKTEVISNLLNANRLSDAKCDCIMIGDTKFDVIGAYNNQIDSVAVCYGFGKREELERENPKYIVKTIEELALIL